MAADYSVALSWAREVLRHPDGQLSARRYRNGDTTVRFTPGGAYMEVRLQRKPYALLTDDERARIERLLTGGGA